MIFDTAITIMFSTLRNGNASSLFMSNFPQIHFLKNVHWWFHCRVQALPYIFQETERRHRRYYIGYCQQLSFLSVACPRSSFFKKWSRVSNEEFWTKRADNNQMIKSRYEFDICYILLYIQWNHHEIFWSSRQQEVLYLFHYPSLFSQFLLTKNWTKTHFSMS